ncbi:virion structural protein [Pseudomonas phage D6]|nr:virion structural protein [Pseudomonas phage D6]
MYITQDYLKVGSWQAVIDMINDKYNFQLQPGIVKLKEMKALGPKRTQIEIIPNRSTNPINLMPEITETIFTYDRLDCTEFFRNTVAVNISGMKLPITTFDILNYIGAKNEIVFEVDDFIHQTFDHYSAIGEADFVIKADPRSLRFVGSLKVRLTNTLKFDLTTLSGQSFEFPDVAQQHDKLFINGNFEMNRFDFTEQRELLRSIPVGLYHDPGKVAQAISRQTTQVYSVKPTPATRSLVHTLVQGEPHCKVLYNGAPIPRWTSRTDCQRVIVIELNTTYCTSVSGYLRLHYN